MLDHLRRGWLEQFLDLDDAHEQFGFLELRGGDLAPLTAQHDDRREGARYARLGRSVGIVFGAAHLLADANQATIVRDNVADVIYCISIQRIGRTQERTLPLSNSAGRAPTSYVFIDGGYLDAFAKQAGERWFGRPAELDYKAVNRAFDGKRTFFYDCIPARNGAESDTDYEAKVAKKEQLFEALRRIPGWHVSEGVAKWRKKAGATQKEVDILIAVDMLTHTYRRNMDSIIFIAGDQDFRPLIEAVVREGMWVNLRYGAISISKELKDTVDDASEIMPEELMALCTRDFQSSTVVPVVSRMHDHPYVYPMEKGEQGENSVATLHGPSVREPCSVIAHYEAPTRQYLIFRGHDVDQLKVYHETYCGPTKWTQFAQKA